MLLARLSCFAQSHAKSRMSLPFGFRSSPLRAPRALSCNIASGVSSSIAQSRSPVCLPHPSRNKTAFAAYPHRYAVPVFHGRLCSAHAGVSHGYRDRPTADEQIHSGGKFAEKNIKEDGPLRGRYYLFPAPNLLPPSRLQK